MDFRVIVISVACLSIFVAPASGTSLLAAAAAVKGAIVGAGLTALKSGAGETVIIQSEPGSVAEVLPANQITVQDLGHKPSHTAQTITYTSSNPISRLWDAVSNIVAAKAKAIGNLFQPNRVVVIVPQTTEKSTTEKPTPVITIDYKPSNNKPPPSGSPIIGVDLDNKPLLNLPTIGVDLNNKPLLNLPTIGVDLNNKPLLNLPTIGVDLNNKPLLNLPAIGVDLNNKPLLNLPTVDVDLNNKPLLDLPTIDVELNNKPLLNLPSIGVDLNNKPLIGASALISRGNEFRRVQPVAFINYLKK